MSKEKPNTFAAAREPASVPDFEPSLAETKPPSPPDDSQPSGAEHWQRRMPVSIRRVAWWSVSGGCAFSGQLSRPQRGGHSPM